MSGECVSCSEHSLDCHCNGDLSDKMILAVVRIGRAQEYLKSILDDAVFDNLSKHNEKWRSEHEREDDLLSETRRSISSLSDNLWSLMCILRPEIN